MAKRRIERQNVGVPKDLLEGIKTVAELSHRSLTSQVMVYLERGLALDDPDIYARIMNNRNI